MSIVVKSSNSKKRFVNKSLINIGTNPKCDFVIELDFDVLLTVQYNAQNEAALIANNFKNQNVLVNGTVLNKTSFDKICKITFKNSSEFVEIEITGEIDNDDSAIMNYNPMDFNPAIDGNSADEIKLQIEKIREPIEKARTSIIKQISYPMTELKNKIRANWRTSLVMHIALYITSLLSSFAVANYLMGLTVQESVRNIYLATNIPAWIAYSFVVMAICLMLKQGIFLQLNENTTKRSTINSKLAKNFMIWVSTIFIIGIYTVNLTYYSVISNFVMFSLFITIFFVGIMTALAISCGYFKANGAAYDVALHKYEFREDFEAVIKAYRTWIERYANSFSEKRQDKIKDKLLSLHIKAAVETIIGILTTPFLAYGVSNTLAICFPEAANWLRISGFRFSPIFLTLSTFLIIFAFFAFVNGFLINKKIQASQVIKQDGFIDFSQHAATIYGLEGTKKLESDKKLSFTIACSIVFIEFMMNISYFMSATGDDIRSVFLSFLAALVPTTLLVAETFILASTRFEIHAHDDIMSKIDKD